MAKKPQNSAATLSSAPMLTQVQEDDKMRIVAVVVEGKSPPESSAQLCGSLPIMRHVFALMKHDPRSFYCIRSEVITCRSSHFSFKPVLARRGILVAQHAVPRVTASNTDRIPMCATATSTAKPCFRPSSTLPRLPVQLIA